MPRRAVDQRPPGAFQGAFGHAQAVRLLQRAGFGPGPGQADQLASLGLVGAVQSLTRPSGAAVLSGPPPPDDEGNPLAPADAWGHDHLWWLDRMVRTNQPLVERMALIFHDWFATSNANVSKAQQMIDQSNLFRSHCFGSFLDLFRAVTIDPAMLQWLNGNENYKWAPNENYGREMMELFSLGADRGAYTEDDIREQARALTGWRNDWSGEHGAYNFRFDPTARHRRQDRVRPTGNWDWEDACRLCVENPLHPSFFVAKLWSYFVPTPPSPRPRRTEGPTRLRLADPPGAGGDPDEPGPLRRPADGEAAGRAAGEDAAVARPLRRHRGLGLALRRGGAAALLAAQRRRLGRHRWLDTSRMRARWNIVTYALEGISVDPWDDAYSATETPEEALARAVAAWGTPNLREEHRAELLDLAARARN